MIPVLVGQFEGAAAPDYAVLLVVLAVLLMVVGVSSLPGITLDLAKWLATVCLLVALLSLLT